MSRGKQESRMKLKVFEKHLDSPFRGNDIDAIVGFSEISSKESDLIK